MISRGYTQQATYWGSPVSNGTGGFSYDAPCLIKVRWEDRQEQFPLQSGDIGTSKAIVFTQQDLDILGYLCLGSIDEFDPTKVHGAFQIKQFRKIPSLSGLKVERRAFL